MLKLRTIVIKCGGSVLDDLSTEFFSGIHALIQEGFHPVIVHGGGPAINAMLTVHNIPSKFHKGMRVTCEKTMEVVEMVLSGQTNRQLVHLLDINRLQAFGLNGSDGKCLQAELIEEKELGLVGQINRVNVSAIYMLLDQGYIPVITPVAVTEDGRKVNVNADYAAASIASALQSERCVFVTNVDGVIINGTIAKQLSVGEIQGLIESGDISGGMIPKVDSSVSAVNQGLEKVMIVSGKASFYSKGSWQGTTILQEEEISK